MSDELNLMLEDNPDLSDKELLSAAHQLTYLKKVFKGSDELEDNFLFSLYEYPKLDLVQRFYHLFGMAIANHIKVGFKVEDALIDDKTYLTLLEDANSLASDAYQSAIFNFLAHKNFPDKEEELDDAENIELIKTGLDEELFMNNIDRIDGQQLFFDAFDTNYVGSKRFESAKKLEYVYQIVTSNYYSLLKRTMNDNVCSEISVYEIIIAFLKSSCYDIASLPDKEAVAYTTTQIYEGLRANTVSEYYLTNNHYRRKMYESYKTLINDHPELNTPYSASQYKKAVEDDIEYQDNLNKTEKVKTKTLYN